MSWRGEIVQSLCRGTVEDTVTWSGEEQLEGKLCTYSHLYLPG